VLTETIIPVPYVCLGVLYQESPLGIMGLITHAASRSGHAIQLSDHDVRRAIEQLVEDGHVELSSTGLRGAKFYSITRRGRDRVRYLRRAIAGVFGMPIQVHEQRAARSEKKAPAKQSLTEEDGVEDFTGGSEEDDGGDADEVET
jgi:DNA-binding PadR family transcriptional regulator